MNDVLATGRDVIRLAVGVWLYVGVQGSQPFKDLLAAAGSGAPFIEGALALVTAIAVLLSSWILLSHSFVDVRVADSAGDEQYGPYLDLRCAPNATSDMYRLDVRLKRWGLLSRFWAWVATRSRMTLELRIVSKTVSMYVERGEGREIRNGIAFDLGELPEGDAWMWGSIGLRSYDLPSQPLEIGLQHRIRFTPPVLKILYIAISPRRTIKTIRVIRSVP